LCGSLKIKEGLTLRKPGNKVLKSVFETERDEIIGDWRKLHNEELRAVLFANFY
jgi:hypothetical protein